MKTRNRIHTWRRVFAYVALKSNDILVNTFFLITYKKARLILKNDSNNKKIRMVLVNYPIILTKTLQLGFRKKHSRTSALDSIPEYESGDSQKGSSSVLDFR